MDRVVLSGLEEWLFMEKHYRVRVAAMLRSVLNLILFSTVIRILFTKIRFSFHNSMPLQGFLRAATLISNFCWISTVRRTFT